MDDVINNFIHTHSMFHLRENKRSIAAHFPGVTLHDLQIRTDRFCQIRFIDH